MKIQVEQDDRIRAVASVLLLTDLVKMNDYWKHPAIRELSTKHLASFWDHPCARVAREINPTKSMGAAFHCLAVEMTLVNGTFGVVPESELYERDFAKEFFDAGFVSFLTDFVEVTALPAFWKCTSALWDETIEDCRAMLSEEDPTNFLAVFYGDIDLDLLVIPNPLNPTSFCYGPKAGRTAYAIVGPPNVPAYSSEPVRVHPARASLHRCCLSRVLSFVA